MERDINDGSFATSLSVEVFSSGSRVNRHYTAHIFRVPMVQNHNIYIWRRPHASIDSINSFLGLGIKSNRISLVSASSEDGVPTFAKE